MSTKNQVIVRILGGIGGKSKVLFESLGILLLRLTFGGMMIFSLGTKWRGFIRWLG